MSNDGQGELAGIVGVRARMRGWPISTTGMSSTSRGLHFDVRDASHGVELVVSACDHHAVMVALGSSRQFACETYRRSREVSCRAGDFIVIPAGSTVRLAGGIPPMLRIGIEPDQLRQESILGEAIRGEDDQTGSILHANDLFALYIGGTILEELRKPEADWRLALLHHLAEALTVHFVTRYGIYTVSDHTGEISDREAIRRIIEHLGRITQDFPDLTSLAKRAGLSRFHFIRVFKAETGMTPLRYVEQCKMEQAKTLIETADIPLAEIAERLGFSDQSHLTRRFKAVVGRTPAAYSRSHARRRSPT
jgi:AraC family transcriptional regulator